MSNEFRNTSSMLVRRRFWAVALFHFLLIATSIVIAWLLRFDFRIPFPTLLFGCVPILILFRVAALARFNLLHGYWRHSGVTDVIDIGKAVALGSLAFFVTTRYVLRKYEFPLSIYILEAIVTAAGLAGARLCAMTLKSRTLVSPAMHKKRRVIVAGAGEAASLLIREMLRTEFVPVACLDDDVFKHGAKIHGVPVVDTIDAIGLMVKTYHAEELFIAIPSANGSQMQRISRMCEQAGVRYRTVPNLHDLLMGRGSISQLREVSVEDLLGRDPVQLDLSMVRNQIAGKVVMVTGAAGSIGSELCRQVLAYHPAKLIALDQAETPMFYLQLQLTKQPAGDRVVYSVADVANTSRMRRILGEGAVEIIFHAAAYKHVPLVELNIRGALNNNVLAVPPLLDVAEECGCEAFVLISSDKAVEPTSFMGATKRLGELMLAARPKKNMRCVSVRFGNVLGSQGSVIPVFKEQIEKESRITITHPEITRFFMTIPEAVSLVLQAFTIGEHGDILVLDMGNPVRILDLAHSLIRQCGKSPSEIKIEFVGLRPGEKLHEDLFYPRERQLPTTNRKVKRTQSEIIPWPALWAHLEDLISLTNSGTEVSIRAKMKEIIPEYSYQTEPVPVQNEPAENAFSPAMDIARAFAAGAGQD
ncbi:MAG TPA: nucleoside-diphosphate sugar epimerase/dehydratase [Terriglobales bacterium]|nr:nucleoside-diphosphate sugar epimerase/dehydratase [Terriglobales bacterium]